RSIDTIVLDKTGTITEGRPALTSVDLLDGATRRDVLRLAGAVEAASEHPIGAAVAAAARAEGGELPAVSRFEGRPGVGGGGIVEGREVTVGRGLGPIEVAWDGEPRARLQISDTVKPTSAAAIAALKGLGLTPVMLTGDSRERAAEVAGEVDVAEAIPEVLPG